MATPGTVVTVEEIVGAVSTMRVTLEEKAESLANQKEKPSDPNKNDPNKNDPNKNDPNENDPNENDPNKNDPNENDPNQSVVHDEALELLNRLFEIWVKEAAAKIENGDADIKDLEGLDEKSKQELLEMNKKNINAITEKTVEKIRKFGKQVEKKLDTVPLHLQPQVVTYWESAQGFFTGVINWLSGMFNYVLEKIRQGYRVVRDAIKGVINTVCSFLGNLFKKKKEKN